MQWGLAIPQWRETTMKYEESPLSATVKGGVAGMLSTAVITAAMKYGPTILRQIGVDAPEPPASARKGEPPEQLAGKVAQGIFDTRLDKEGKQIVGQAIHWTYGAGWGALYGILQSTLRLPFMVHGTLLGALMA